MLKQLTLSAAIAISAFSFAPLPGVTSSALAQSNCTASVCRPPQSGPSTSYRCVNDLGHLRRVYEEELEQIDDPQRVSINPVCVGESYGIMRSDGNAGALRQIIAGNDAMQEALFRKNFGADDVVAVRMLGADAVLLFVHPFHRLY